MKHLDKCSICEAEYDEDAGGVQGYFGIMPVTFCEWCYASVYDMVAQDYMLTKVEENEE